MEIKGGVKQSGLRFDLIPPDAMAELAYVYTAGAKKYADRNWEGGYAWSKSIRALKSHLAFFEAGEDTDEETHSYHMAQVVWHAMALLTFQLREIGVDDRHVSLMAQDNLHITRNRQVPDIQRAPVMKGVEGG